MRIVGQVVRAIQRAIIAECQRRVAPGEEVERLRKELNNAQARAESAEQITLYAQRDLEDLRKSNERDREIMAEHMGAMPAHVSQLTDAAANLIDVLDAGILTTPQIRALGDLKDLIYPPPRPKPPEKDAADGQGT